MTAGERRGCGLSSLARLAQMENTAAVNYLMLFPTALFHSPFWVNSQVRELCHSIFNCFQLSLLIASAGLPGQAITRRVQASSLVRAAVGTALGRLHGHGHPSQSALMSHGCQGERTAALHPNWLRLSLPASWAGMEGSALTGRLGQQAGE